MTKRKETHLLCSDHVQSTNCVFFICLFIISPFPFDFCFFFVFSDSAHAEQQGGNYNITQHVCQDIRNNDFFVTFYSVFFFYSPSHFHSPLLYVWQYMVRVVTVLLRIIGQVILNMLFWSAVCGVGCVCVCVWHMADTLSGDCGWQSDLLPLAQPLNLPPKRGSGNIIGEQSYNTQ